MKSLCYRFIPALVALVACLTACSQRELYSEFRTLDAAGWHADEALDYDFEVSDTISRYSVLLYVRNRTDYPYQNIWLFVNSTRPDGTHYADTIEFYLADERGHWLGRGIGGLKEMPVLYQQDVRFPQTGHYSYSLRHAMRDTLLRGVSDVGLEIVAYE